MHLLFLLLQESYYPLDVNYEWTYAADGDTVTCTVQARTKVKEFECFAVRETRKGVKTTYYFSSTGTGVMVHKVNDQVLPEPVVLFKFPLTAGQKWTISSSSSKAQCEVAAVDEEIEVPAGRFKCVRVRTEGKEGNSTEQWLAEGVGMVKTVSERNGQKKTMELKSFEGPQAQVKSAQELRDAVAKAKPGAKILIAPGDYGSGHHFSKLSKITLAAADPKNPPVFESMHLSEIEHVELEGLVFKGAKQNGLNIDDGGKYDKPSHHVVLRNLKVSDVGDRGNQDGIKLSGIDDFRIEGCTIERWGTGGGSAIDMVGCHKGVIENCTLKHPDPGQSTGIQMKGGCADITVRKNRFDNAGSRAVNIGGSTGLEYFRPPLKNPPHCEAKDIKVEGNVFIGSDAPIAFVGVDGAVVRFNTIHVPRRWAIRILQETTEAGFVPCRKGEFSNNLVVFRSNQGGVNIGPNTEPKSFVFSKNFWFCVDAPAQSKPTLPTDEKDGVYGKDPMLGDDMKLRQGSPARGYGADGFK